MDPHGPFRRDARLILTAACLHLQADVAVRPSLSGLLTLLRSFAAGQQSTVLWASSPMQFLQYAAAELAALDPYVFRAALETCIQSTVRRMSKYDSKAV